MDFNGFQVDSNHFQVVKGPKTCGDAVRGELPVLRRHLVVVQIEELLVLEGRRGRAAELCRNSLKSHSKSLEKRRFQLDFSWISVGFQLGFELYLS